MNIKRFVKWGHNSLIDKWINIKKNWICWWF